MSCGNPRCDACFALSSYKCQWIFNRFNLKKKKTQLHEGNAFLPSHFKYEH